MADEVFPYFTSLHVNDCYTYQDFDIPIGVGSDKPFRHLILTGKNGSGKTTILQGIDIWMESVKIPTDPQHYSGLKIVPISKPNEVAMPRLDKHYNLYKFFRAQRSTSLNNVSTVFSDVEFQKQIDSGDLSKLLKQFLINKKVNQAFAIIENNGKVSKEQNDFFDLLETIMQEMLEDKDLNLIFAREEYEFYLQYSNGRRVTFNQLSHGFSAFIAIVLELLVRVDMIQSRQKNYAFDLPGIVLIDEPEAHLHLELQYDVMPLLTTLFPNVQFIIATHSPAVVSSIKDATVFDLTTKEVAKDWVVGSSFSELMTEHFGLDDEFSNIADDIMNKAQQIVDSSIDVEAKLAALKKLFVENERYLSPAFYLSMESQIIRLEKSLMPT